MDIDEVDELALRREIVMVCQELSKHGLVSATDGNITARLSPNRFLVTPSAVSKAQVSEGSILICDEQGKRIAGSGAVTSEIHLHLAAYRERPNIGAVVHAHPPCATAFTYCGMDDLFRLPIVPEVVAQLGPIPTIPFTTPGTSLLGEVAAPYFRLRDLLLLQQHGAVSIGQDPWRAYLRIEKLEHTARMLRDAVLIGGRDKLKILSKEQIVEILEQYVKGGPYTARVTLEDWNA